MKICSLYGAGFYYIPGTDTCIKIGGFVRAEINFNAGGSFNAYRAQNFDSPTRNFQTTRTRGGITADVRSQTEYGTLRSYVNMYANQTNGGSPNTAGSVAPGGNGYSALYSSAAFIQFAGFTIGQTESFFTFDGTPYTNGTPYFSSSQAGNGIWVAAYTAQLGNGLSASIAAEDPTVRQSSILTPLTAAPATGVTGVSGYGGRRWTDFVGNIRIDQAWGSAQVMGAIHDVYGVSQLTAPVTTYSQTGYAFGVGAKLNLPMLGKGDYIQGQFTWSKGATNYVLDNSGFGGVGAFALTSGFPVTVASSRTALGPVLDAVIVGGGAGTGMDLTTTWSVTGGYEHNWVPGLKTSLYGAYGKAEYSTAASAAIAASIAGFAATGSTSANWSAWQIGSRTVWTPVTNLDLSVDVIYSKVNGAFGGSSSTTHGTYGDRGFWAGMFRAQRNFYP